MGRTGGFAGHNGVNFYGAYLLGMQPKICAARMIIGRGNPPRDHYSARGAKIALVLEAKPDGHGRAYAVDVFGGRGVRNEEN